jgi:REP element-mobilizing transposase RayT
MARPLRLEFAGAVYHVVSRGHERSKIFRNHADREAFLKMLGFVARDLGWRVHAYCLMANHYDLLIETPSPNLSLGMRALNGRYTQKYNRLHDRTGHLFEGRYRAILIQKEARLLDLHRYVVLNPVRAGVASNAGDWEWSSYRATGGRAPQPVWLEVDWTLGQFGRSRRLATEEYRRFVRAGKGQRSPLEDVRGQIYLGDERFIRSVLRRAPARDEDEEIPLSQRRPWSVGLDEIRRAVAKEFRVPVEGLSRSRGGEDKMAAIYLARKLTGLTGREIGDAFDVRPARVSNVVREIEEEDSRKLRPRVERLRAKLLNVQ